MTGRCLIVAGVALLAIACNQESRSKFLLPTSPTATTPPVVLPPPSPVFVPPAPRQFPPFEITTVEVGDEISRTNLDAPECLGEPTWPCIYFRVVAPRTGTLEVALTYTYGTQGSQAVDVTLREAGTSREVWAQFWDTSGPRWRATVTAPVVGGKTYDIALWYTFPKLEYDLRLSMR